MAILVRRDQHHAQALELFSRSGIRYVTSHLVFSESYSWFLHRHGEEAARNFRAFVGALKGLDILPSSAAGHDNTLRMLDRFRGAKLTYVDGSSLSIIERRSIGRVWSTDHHLGLTGAEILPRS